MTHAADAARGSREFVTPEAGARDPLGMGGLGNGGTPHTADAHDGSGGVGIRNWFPCVAADPPTEHAPVYVSRLGYGVVKPSVSVCRNITS